MSKEAGSGNPKVLTESQKVQLELLCALPQSVFYNHTLDIAKKFVSDPDDVWGVGCSDNDILYCTLFKKGLTPQDLHKSTSPTTLQGIGGFASYYEEVSRYITNMFQTAQKNGLSPYAINFEGDDINATLSPFPGPFNSRTTSPHYLGAHAVGIKSDLEGATKFFDTLAHLRGHHKKYMIAVDELRGN